ncbi:MAG: quinol monooxygenase YgiN [Gammaproteobacteria bacterium]|jgi:quinol monooxygenase YgiN
MTCQVALELKTEPDCVDKARDWFTSILPDTRGFAGFVTLHIGQNQDDPTELLVVEQWDFREAYEKYLGWRTERGDMEAIAGMVATEPKIRFFDYFGV